MADLLPKLAAMEARVLSLQPSRRKWNGDVTEAIGDPEAEAHLPHPRGSSADLEWRAQKAVTMLREYRAWCEKEGLA